MSFDGEIEFPVAERELGEGDGRVARLDGAGGWARVSAGEGDGEDIDFFEEAALGEEERAGESGGGERASEEDIGIGAEGDGVIAEEENGFGLEAEVELGFGEIGEDDGA